MTHETVNINFENSGYKGKVFSGRSRGELARKQFNLNDLDNRDIRVNVVVPNGLFSLTSSFFLGMFGPTLRTLGSKERFQQKYHFTGPEPILEELDQYIDTELRRSAF